ncbi:hypothetical protein P691DRAFT_429223 [Macrolepiota fuliginosa MF-IS2]|uniref:Uncharacterized protein n=1 Tax=Macrolepiota fuliginosa MF-IS2 TaxID=1400762 RepID=A0A9P5XI70_9AGAR|nr:hypothetical protein P691DRAFT_429223 [Macrolepiota fuliginosa MF-IS2]
MTCDKSRQTLRGDNVLGSIVRAHIVLAKQPRWRRGWKYGKGKSSFTEGRHFRTDAILSFHRDRTQLHLVVITIVMGIIDEQTASIKHSPYIRARTQASLKVSHRTRTLNLETPPKINIKTI